MDDHDPTTELGPAVQSRPVTQRTLLAVAVITGLLSVAAGSAISAVILERGAEGPRGVAGPPGPVGEAGEATVDSEDVLGAIEDESGRVAAAVTDELEFAPASVESDLEDVRSTADDAATAAEEVRSDLANLCSDLGFAEALSNEILSC
jgi:hypothetical protein